MVTTVERKFKINKIMIKFIRESIWFKGFALLLAVTILNLACNQPQILPIETVNTNLEYRNSVQIPEGAHIARDFELSYEMVSSVNNGEDSNSIHELSQVFFGDSTKLQVVEEEVSKYSNLGFDNYLNDIVNRGFVPSEFKDEMMNFKQDLTNFIYDTHPTKEEFLSFISSKKIVEPSPNVVTSVTVTNTCTGQVETVSGITEVTQ